MRSFRAWATVEEVKTGKHVDVLVTRRSFEEPWLFSDGDVGLLMEPPAGYIDNLMNEMALENKRLFELARQNLAQLNSFATALNLPPLALKDNNVS